MPSEGDRIGGRYELASRVGEGGMGVVWRARDTKLGRAIALKLLSAASVGNDVARSRLIREARAAAALEHEGIVRIYDVGETDDGGAFLVMELIRGRSLRDAMIAGSLGFARRAAVIAAAGRALGFAHDAGIVHRDVKPDNIMIRDDGRVVVVDFGVAKPVASELVANADTVAAHTGGALTGAGMLVGTPAYLAPEQARGQEVSHATDQFALAVTAYEAFTGKLPWKGEGVADVVASLLRDDPPPVSAEGKVPAAFDPVLARALSKAPSDRFASMEELVAALEKAAIEMPTDAPSLPKMTPIGAPKTLTASTHGGQAASAAPSTRASSRRRNFGAAIAIGVVGIGATAWVTFHSGSPAPPTASSMSTPIAPRADAPIACPPFEVSGVDERWLGAAAAALACERVQIARGGLDASTLVPAELLDIPHDVGSPIDGGVDANDARDRAVASAKRRGARWLDGRLEKQATGFKAIIVLRRADGSEVLRGEGVGVEIFEAVREAARPILASEPASTEESARLREWLDVESVDDALALLDVETAILIEDNVSTREACDAAIGRATLSPRVLYLTKTTCARRLRTGAHIDAPPAIDASTPGALITTTLAQGTAGGPAAVRDRAALLEQRRDVTTTPEGKARLAAAAAEIYNSIGDERARSLARAAVVASTKAFDWRANAWHRAVFATEGDVVFANILASWHPWEPGAHSIRASRDDQPTSERLVDEMGRAYLLSQRGFYANAYGDLLVRTGKIEAARSIAEATNDELLRVQIMMGEAKYGAVLASVPKLIAALPTDDKDAALAFRFARIAATAAATLGRPADFMDAVVARYVESEPTHVVDGVIPFGSLVTACALAPRAIGKRCIARLQQLKNDNKLPTIFAGADVAIAGAVHYVADDYAGAAKVWRTFLRAPGFVQDSLREPLAIAFDRGGVPELGDEIDAQSIAMMPFARSAELAWVRAALRAQKRGDYARAKQIAQMVVDKWRFADEDIPSVRDMKALLVKP